MRIYFSDDVGGLLRAANKFPTITKEKRTFLNQAVAIMNGNSYITFTGQSQNYFFSRVLESYIYDVQAAKTVHLKPFRGQQIRVIDSHRVSWHTLMLGYNFEKHSYFEK